MKKLYYKILDIFFPCNHEYGPVHFEWVRHKQVVYVKEYKECTKCGERTAVYYREG